MLSRRTLLTGVGISLITAPAVVRNASLMPVRGIIMPINQNTMLLPGHYVPFGKYKLVGRVAVKVTDLLEWAKGFESTSNNVAKDQVGKVAVSTVFLGLDHNFMREGPPTLFETMVFGGKLDGDMRRYSTYEEAERGHKETMAEVQRSQLRIVRNGDS